MVTIAITYANFGIDCSSDDSNLTEAYNEFRARLSDFCVDDELSTSLEPLYIVNKTVYELLKKHYPRMQFIPILPGDE